MEHCNLFQSWNGETPQVNNSGFANHPSHQSLPEDLLGVELQPLDTTFPYVPPTTTSFPYVPPTNSSLINWDQSSGSQRSSSTWRQPRPTYENREEDLDVDEYACFRGNGDSFISPYDQVSSSLYGDFNGHTNPQLTSLPPGNCPQYLINNEDVAVRSRERFSHPREIVEPHYGFSDLSLGNYSDNSVQLLPESTYSRGASSSPQYAMQSHSSAENIELTASGKPRKRRPKKSLQNLTAEERRAHEREINRPAQARYRVKKEQQQQHLEQQLAHETARHSDLNARYQELTDRINDIRLRSANY
ncbi:uncharacterized protein LOC108666771 [Hyalella azteca]|uniref:Uncharacterized protein LOC108666771 n=1 Tax=Hyalella azteca TaxID=294128 RepID=A0A8B7N7D8_HYAAZ|nr:uncharacterized protein LOC108666771 [Hyalella azteca]